MGLCFAILVLWNWRKRAGVISARFRQTLKNSGFPDAIVAQQQRPLRQCAASQRELKCLVCPTKGLDIL